MIREPHGAEVTGEGGGRRRGRRRESEAGQGASRPVQLHLAVVAATAGTSVHTWAAGQRSLPVGGVGVGGRLPSSALFSATEVRQRSASSLLHPPPVPPVCSS